jgi:hypothetical protein
MYYRGKSFSGEGSQRPSVLARKSVTAPNRAAYYELDSRPEECGVFELMA